MTRSALNVVSTVAAVAASVALSATAVPVEDFAFSAADYAPGEALSAKGVRNARWEIPAGSSVTNVYDGVTNGMAVATEFTNAVQLVADRAAALEDFRQFDFTMNAGRLSAGVSRSFDGTAALTPSLLDDGTLGFYGWGDDAWRELTCDGADALVRDGGWIDGRIELKTVGGMRFASYFVRIGGVWTRLRTADGCVSFRVKAEAAQTTCGVAGTGRLASVAVTSDEAQRTVSYYWIGGTSGDWNVASNWSLTPGGAAAEKAPDAAGEAGVVTGRVEIVRGEETATVRDFVVTFGDGGSTEVLGGRVGGTPTLDTNRPRLGKKMTVATPTFFGRKADYAYRWYDGKYDRSSFSMRSVGESFVPSTDVLERWVRVIALDDQAGVWTNEFYFSRLPVAYMTTDDGALPSDAKEEHDGTIRIQGNDAYKMQYDGAMVIKARGNTSLTHFEKNPYKIKLDKKTNLFDMGKNKHWVLLANMDDKTSLRNKLAYDLANKVGGLGMDSTWMVCFLNGQYRGLYQVGEHIRPDAKRVPVYDWEGVAGDLADAFNKKHGLKGDDKDAVESLCETNFTWVTADELTYVTNGVAIVDKPSELLGEAFPTDITSGYILEFSEEMDDVSKFTTTATKLTMPTMVNKPEYLCSNKTMFDWVKNMMQDYWGACTSADRCVPAGSKYTRTGRHYSEFCDVDSMAMFTLVNELFTNNDAGHKSRYAYIENGKITWGPVWDFDHGSGSASVCSDARPYGVTNTWTVAKKGDTSMITQWSSDFYFCQRLFALYWQYRDLYTDIIKEGGDIDTYVAYIREAAVENDKRWGGRKFGNDLGYLRRNLTDRLNWLDQQFTSVTNLIESFRSDKQAVPSTWNPAAESTPVVDEKGRRVPAIPLEWVRAANVGADPSFAYATESRLNAAVTAAPSAWGKKTPVWEDYMTGTEPSDTNDFFKVTAFSVVDGVPSFEYEPNLGEARRYDVLGRENLGDDDGWHTWQPGDRFFKIGVSLP